MRCQLPQIVRGCAAALLLAAVAPAGAGAAVTFTSAKLEPSTKQAGSHPNVTIDMSFAAAPDTDDLKSLRVVLPQGLVGNPSAADRCTEADFMADSCADGSRVGTTTVSADVTVLPGVDVPQDSDGDVYNLTPKPGEPARLGVVVRPQAPAPKIFLESAIAIGADTDYGLASSFDDIPRTAGALEIRITRMLLTLNAAAAHGAFVTNPTDCRTATMTATAGSYDAPDDPDTTTASFTPTGCDKLPFSPNLTGTIGGVGRTAAQRSPALTTVIAVGPGQANPRRVSVTLPPSAGPDLTHPACTPDQLAANTCPATTRVGTATAETPLLASPLSGPVLFVAAPGDLPRLVVQLKGLVNVQLLGSTSVVGGILANVFDGIPDVPLARFELTVDGGAGSLLRNSKDLCGPPAGTTVQAAFVAHSGATHKQTVPLTVLGCPIGKPKATVKLRFRKGKGTLTARLLAGKNAPPIRTTSLQLPPGLTPTGKKPASRVIASSGRDRIARKDVRVRGRTVGLSTARGLDIALRWTGLAARGALARHLEDRPRLAFKVLLTDTRGKITQLAPKTRPSLAR